MWNEDPSLIVMTNETLKCLKLGDVVQNKVDGREYVVIANDGERVTAVTAVNVTNPDDWYFVMAQVRTKEEVVAYRNAVASRENVNSATVV